MSAGDDVLASGKPFDELTDDEMAALESRQWTAEEVMRAISLALQQRDMPAAANLLCRLAVLDPDAAELVLLTLKATEAAP